MHAATFPVTYRMSKCLLFQYHHRPVDPPGVLLSNATVHSTSTSVPTGTRALVTSLRLSMEEVWPPSQRTVCLLHFRYLFSFSISSAAEVWDPSWGPVPNLSVITALTHGPPTPQQVLNYLNIRFRLNRRAYCMALDILFPQPAESPTRLGIPVYQRVLETSQWRRNHPDWEGGIVPVDREVGSALADDAADSQAGSDDEDSGDGVLTTRERRAIRSRVASLLPDAYRAHLAAEQASSASSGSASSSSTSFSRSDSVESSGDTSLSSSSPNSGSSSFSSGPGSPSPNTSSNPSSEHASSSSSSPSSTYSSYSPRKRRHDEDEGSNADSNITVVEGHPSARPATRRRLDSDGEALANTEAHPDTEALPAPPSASPASASRHRRRLRAEGGEQEQRKLMRQYQHLSPPIRPPGVRTGGPESASTSQGRAFTSDLDAAGPGPVAYVPAQPVAGSSRPRDDEDHVEPLPVRRSPKRLRDEDTSEMPGHLLEDGVGGDKAGKRNKKRSRKE